MSLAPVVTPAPTLLSILSALRWTTLRDLCLEISERQGCSMYRCYTATREMLDALVRAGEVQCWSTAKPMFVRTQDAPVVRAELKAALYQEIAQRGQATPGKLKSVPLAGSIIAMDLMQELADELIHEGKIENVGRKGMGRTKIYVPVGEVAQQDMDLGVSGQVLRYLKGLHDRNLFRETATNITSKLKLAREEVDNALAHLEAHGLIEVTQHEGGFLRFYAFAAKTMVIRQVDPSTLSVAQTAYAPATQEAAVTELEMPVEDVRPVRPAHGVVSTRLLVGQVAYRTPSPVAAPVRRVARALQQLGAAEMALQTRSRTAPSTLARKRIFTSRTKSSIPLGGGQRRTAVSSPWPGSPPPSLPPCLSERLNPCHSVAIPHL